MFSGVGPGDELRQLGVEVVADLPGVGQNLQDHPLVAGLCFEARDVLAPLNNNLSGSALFWKSRSGLRVPDLMVLPIQIPFVSPEIAETFAPPPNSFCIIPTLVRPESRGYLRMRTADRYGDVEIQPNFLAERADVEALLTGIELGLDIAAQPAYRELIRSWVAPRRRMNREQAKRFLASSCMTYFHPVGTCAMGPGPDATSRPSRRPCMSMSVIVSCGSPAAWVPSTSLYP